MKRVLAAAAAVVVIGVTTAPAAALTPNQRLTRLEKRVTALEKQNKTLKTQLKNANDAALAGLLFAVCGTAVAADELQATWATINQVAGRTVIAAQPAVSEPVCSRLQVPRGGGTPSMDPFAQLMRLVNQPSGLVATYAAAFG